MIRLGTVGVSLRRDGRYCCGTRCDLYGSRIFPFGTLRLLSNYLLAFDISMIGSTARFCRTCTKARCLR
jgi:hypothetical protein